MRYAHFLLIIFFATGCNNKTVIDRTRYFPKQVENMIQPPDKQHVWIFILAGQSNMAGRGIVEPQDTIPNEKILTINKDGRLIVAKEPLHWYEPEKTGLDCGYSFGKTITKNISNDDYVLLIPTAIGGSSIS